ncbi:MAG TPA: lipid-A-disaccharide synthase [Bacteroidetes bacterium]|nr:lipid-A-disaccharide synthase [Bacteroidota bacterium]
MIYYLIAGEASGDLHASNLMKELKKQDPQAEFRFWGGDLMQAVGGENVSHYKERAFMGFVEVVVNLKTVLGHIKHCKADLAAHIPDALILVDYPGFNMRIAEYAKSLNIPVFYYISPQIWAWKEGRIKGIKAFVDHMFVILPFEKPFYAKHQYEVDYVGHPLLDAVKDSVPDENFATKWKLDKGPLLALLPGSRKQEIKKKLPLMLSVMDDFPDYQFVLAAAPGIDPEYYLSFTQSSRVKVVQNDTYQLLMHAEAALVTSGTATLETALFGVPQVVCYKTSAITYAIAKRLVKIKFISLVNLIMDKEVVKELIQGELNTSNLSKELKAIVAGGLKRRKIMDAYAELKAKLGDHGASEKTARLILHYLGARLRS